MDEDFTGNRLHVIIFIVVTILFIVAGAVVSHAEELLPTVSIEAAASEWARFKKSRPSEAGPISVKFSDGSIGKMVYHGNPRNLARRFARRRRQSYRVSIPDPSGNLPKKTVIYRAKPEDRTFMREWLAYRIFNEAKIKSPSARIILLEVNGDTQGVFVEVIPVDPLFVRKSYGNDADRALLYYGDPKRKKKRHIRADFVPFDRVSDYPLAYTPVIVNRDPEYKELDALLRTLNSDPFDISAVRKLIDLDEWASWFSISEILESADSPWFKGARNYSLLRPPSGKWEILPWDLDHVYRGKDIYMPETKVRGLRALTSDPVFIEMKKRYLRQFLRGKFSAKKLIAWIDEMGPAIEAAIKSGKEKSVPIHVWKREVKKLKQIITERHELLLDLAD